MKEEANEKDRSLKTELLLSANSQSPEIISSDPLWNKQEYFSDERVDFNIEKRNYPENALCYINHEYLLTVKVGKLVVYQQKFILGQLVVAGS